MELTTKQKKVFKAAEKRMENASWFQSVCCDNFPTDKEIDEDFGRCVQHVVMETEMWDAWDKDGFIPLRSKK